MCVSQSGSNWRSQKRAHARIAGTQLPKIPGWQWQTELTNAQQEHAKNTARAQVPLLACTQSAIFLLLRSAHSLRSC
eukprot:982383-Pelagomonas_calceolata.AAC.2